MQIAEMRILLTKTITSNFFLGVTSVNMMLLWQTEDVHIGSYTLSFKIHGVFIVQLGITMHGKKISNRLCIHLFLITGDGLRLFGVYANKKHTRTKNWGQEFIFFLLFKIEGQIVGNHGDQNTLKYDCTSGDIFHGLCLFDSKLISEF